MKNLKGILLIAAIFLAGFQITYSQNIGISTTGATPNSNAILDIVSPSSSQGKGLLIPRISYAQRTIEAQSGGLLDGSGDLHGGAAQGLMIYQTDASGDGEGFYYNTSTTATPEWVYISNNSVSERSNHVIVKSLSDFPDPVSGVITLVDYTSYEICGSVNMGSNRIVLGENNMIAGKNKFNDALIYTGSSDLISGTNKSICVKTLTFVSGTTGSAIFNISGSTNMVHIYDVLFNGCESGGTFNSAFSVNIDDIGMMNCGTGFTFQGSIYYYFYNNNKHCTNTGTIVNISSGTIYCLQMQGNYYDVPLGNTAVNIASSGLSVSDAIITGNFFRGGGAYITGISTETTGYIFEGNSGIKDSDAFGFCRFWANSNATSVSSKYPTYYKVNGVNNNAYGERFVYSVDNQLKYVGSKTITAKFIINGNVEATSPNENIRIAVYKNGITKIEEVEIRTMNANQPYGMGLNGSVSLSTNDYLEIWVSNITSTADVRIVDFQFRVEK
ncbi:MAG: hypothetical protein HN431_04425 [Bacteroidetes bacterium]|jgi:hypothetical protein|nr:hypothetical protein [Bacteroidota bacterium]